MCSTTTNGLPDLVDAGLEDLGDARVVQLGLDARLVEEARQEGAVLGVLSADDLDHAGALRPFDPAGGGEEDLAHSPPGEESQQRQTPKPAGKQVFRVPRLGFVSRIIS